MILLILLKSFLALVSALLGAGFTFIFKLNHTKLCILISLSAGALLGAAAFTLIPESSAQLGLVELIRSEERRVGRECRARLWRIHLLTCYDLVHCCRVC